MFQITKIDRDESRQTRPLAPIHYRHKSIKARRYRGLWLFTASFVLDKQLHLCCLLKYEGKKKYQSKVPSINKLCFLFPLSPFSPVLYLLVFEFSIVIVNHVKGLGPFIDLWYPSNSESGGYR